MRAKALIWSAIFAFLADQITKIWVIQIMDLANRFSIDVLPPLLRFRYGENTGINFGLFGGGTDTTRWVLIAVSLAICVGLTVWILRLPRDARAMQISAGFVIGGALGNVLDRVVFGYVLDFLNTSCCGINNPFVFNVADVFIFAGAAGLIWFDGRQKNPA
ncbi:signal peptidase II [Phaeobacter sp.]|uniref:signal peptidase II n=1 Tax=Phaeobacter sp. TaxID=1902409 RepID=UPI0025F64F1A|nr:signal peptidase II [Phaeobacter sp.]